MLVIDHIFIALFLAVCCVSDIRKKRLGTWLLQAGGGIGAVLLIVSLCVGAVDLMTALSGLFVGAGAVLISKITGEKLGMGDAVLILICCPFVGAIEGLAALLAAFLAAAVFSVGLLLIKRCGLKYELPFVPFMLAGAAFMMVTG